MTNVVPLHQAPTHSRTIAYGRHGCVQVFEGCEADYAPARQNFERILSYRPRQLFFLIDDGDSWLYVEAGRYIPPAHRRP